MTKQERDFNYFIVFDGDTIYTHRIDKNEQTWSAVDDCTDWQDSRSFDYLYEIYAAGPQDQHEIIDKGWG